MRRTRGHHDAIEPFAGNLFAQQRLAGIGAHVLVVQRHAHAGDLGREFRHLGHIDRAGDVLAAPAEEHAYAGHFASMK